MPATGPDPVHGRLAPGQPTVCHELTLETSTSDQCGDRVQTALIPLYSRKMWLLYQMAMASSLLVAAPYLIARRGRHYLSTLPGRLGRYEDTGEAPARGALWLHAVSVGEVGVARTLASALPDDLPLLVTTVTPTGQELARKAFAGTRATVAYLPFDLGFAVERFFDRFAPAALILIEGDYWPLVLRAARARGLPVAVANGRVSQRSFPRLRRLYRLSPRLCQTFFDPVERFAVQTADDGRRLVELGVAEERIVVSGNLKYDTPAPALDPRLREQMHHLADGRPVLVAGSTMAGEEDLVLDAFENAGGGRRALLVLAPRHPERFDAVADRLAERSIPYCRRSEIEGGRQGSEPHPAVLLLDTLGELAALYRLADLAFIGGTLVPTGGHNPLESARFGVPTVVGPSMHNFQQIAEDFEGARAWSRVDGPEGLRRVLNAWLAHPDAAGAVGQRAAELVASGRGATARTLDFLAPMLPPTAAIHRAPEDPGD